MFSGSEDVEADALFKRGWPATLPLAARSHARRPAAQAGTRPRPPARPLWPPSGSRMIVDRSTCHCSAASAIATFWRTSWRRSRICNRCQKPLRAAPPTVDPRPALAPGRPA